MKGRKPKPTRLKLLAGETRRINKREPKPKRVIPSPPEHVSEAAKLAWGSLSTRLDRLGLLTELDSFSLEKLCETYVETLEIQKVLRVEGRFQRVTTKTGDVMIRAHPGISAFDAAERRFRALMTEFGLTPSSRSRIEIESPSADADPAEAYFA